MPVYALNGNRLLHFAAPKEHYSIYAATDQPTEAFTDELVDFDFDNGTVCYPMLRPVAVKLIGQIAPLRAKEITECDGGGQETPT